MTLLLLVVYSTDALNKTIAKANKKEGANLDYKKRTHWTAQ
jgi:hypothetical protein